jgi:polysaccharide export outer membrane protein
MLFRRFLVVLLLGFGLIRIPAFAQDQPPPAAELLKYVRDARSAGVEDSQIEQNALKAGWTAASVSDALTHAGTPKQSANQRPLAKPELAEIPPASATPPPEPSPANVPPPAKANETASPDATLAPPATGPAKPEIIDRGVPDDYQIGAGDVLSISVWREPEASVASVVVRPDGKISMPLLKGIAVAGMTPTEAEKFITERLVKLIKVPDVTVVVNGISSKKVYAVGAVKREGPIPYTYKMNVMQAISEAGGLTDYAKRKKIYILRSQGGREYRLPFDYDAAMKGEHMELNHQLLPGDTLVVPH